MRLRYILIFLFAANVIAAQANAGPQPPAVAPQGSNNPPNQAVPAGERKAEGSKNFWADGWAGKTGFGYALGYPSYLSGIFQFAEVSLEGNQQRFIASSETTSTIVGGNIKSSNGVLNTGYDFSVFRFKFFIFTNYEFGVVSGLNSNTAIGSGVRYTAIKTQLLQLDVSAAPIYERSAYADNVLNEAFSISMRGRLKLFITADNSLFISWFYIRAANNANNQWHAADIVDNMQLAGKVSLRAGYRWRYDLFSDTAAGLGYLIAVLNFSS